MTDDMQREAFERAMFGEICTDNEYEWAWVGYRSAIRRTGDKDSAINQEQIEVLRLRIENYIADMDMCGAQWASLTNFINDQFRDFATRHLTEQNKQRDSHE